MGADALERPTSLMATEIGASEIDTLVDDARHLPALRSIVVMENQLEQPDVTRLQCRLPNVEVVQAAFISGVVYQRYRGGREERGKRNS